jgi:hypothetical protein
MRNRAPLKLTTIDVLTMDIDAWPESMNQLWAASSPSEEKIMRPAIEGHRKQAKGRLSPTSPVQ